MQNALIIEILLGDTLSYSFKYFFTNILYFLSEGISAWF